MKRKIISLILALVTVLSLCGCGGTMGEIASNVVDAAKIKVVEMKTVVGQLNDDGKYQFFTAALIQTDSTTIAQNTADTLAKLFTEAGLAEQTQSKLESPYLIHKTIEFKHTDFSEGNYYVIYAYHKDLAANLPKISADTTDPT